MAEAALQEELRGALAELGLEVVPEQVDALLALAKLLEEWGQRMNLSGHRSAAAVVRRLILDAAALLVAAPPFASLADLGSGAGFPGLPIAILRPGVRVTLVDARERRFHFQRAACRTLGLENVEPIRGRLEDLEAYPHEAVLAQALARPRRAVEWMRPWAAPGGWLLIPGSEEGAALPGGEGGGEGLASAERRRYRVPGGPRRTLWVGRLP